MTFLEYCGINGFGVLSCWRNKVIHVRDEDVSSFVPLEGLGRESSRLRLVETIFKAEERVMESLRATVESMMPRGGNDGESRG